MSKSRKTVDLSFKAKLPRLKTQVRAGLRIALLAILVFLCLPLVLVPIYRFVPPPVTTVMLVNLPRDGWPQRQWVPLERISTNLQYAVVMSEDGQFCSHGGVDWSAVRQVVADFHAGQSPRGASTLTMQVAKNLFLPPNRSYVRKFLEVPLSYYIELWWPKRRILEVYLNSAEWDIGIYGAEAAALSYFRVSAASLSPVQGARLAAILPNPRARDASDPTSKVRGLSRKVLERARNAGAYVTCLGS